MSKDLFRPMRIDQNLMPWGVTGYQSLEPIRRIPKGWGYELIWAHFPPHFTAKILHFDREGARMSLHFHGIKSEFWRVMKGRFRLEITTKQAVVWNEELHHGDVRFIPACVPHSLTALEAESEIMEVSTLDDVDDSYRIRPGDSQTAGEKVL